MPTFRALVPLRWSDVDIYRHVNNVQYLKLLEEARVIAFTAWDEPGERAVLDSGVLVARTEIEYLRQLDFRPEPVAVDLWVSNLAGASFDMCYEVRDPDGDPAPYARAETTLVMFDLTLGRPRRLTPLERERLAEWSGEPVTMRWRR